MKKLNIHITNICNEECSTCYSCSAPYNTFNMNFHTFHHIINSFGKERLRIHLEGGEFSFNSDIYLFLSYLAQKNNVDIVFLETNGTLLKQQKNVLFPLLKELKLPIVLSFGITSYLLDKYPYLLDQYKNIESLLEEWNLSDFVSYRFLVEYINDEDKVYLESKLTELKWEKTYYFIAQAMGRLQGTEYPLPTKPDINNYYYALDGKCFYNDVIERNKYDSFIQKDPYSIPTFDYTNFKELWKGTIDSINKVTFDNRLCIESPMEFQTNYIISHVNEYTKYIVKENIMDYALYYSFMFHDKEIRLHNPFVINDICARNLVKEFKTNLEYMYTTLDHKLFSNYKENCSKIAKTLSLLNVKKEIQII